MPTIQQHTHPREQNDRNLELFGLPTRSAPWGDRLDICCRGYQELAHETDALFQRFQQVLSQDLERRQLLRPNERVNARSYLYQNRVVVQFNDQHSTTHTLNDADLSDRTRHLKQQILARANQVHQDFRNCDHPCDACHHPQGSATIALPPPDTSSETASSLRSSSSNGNDIASVASEYGIATVPSLDSWAPIGEPRNAVTTRAPALNPLNPDPEDYASTHIFPPAPWDDDSDSSGAATPINYNAVLQSYDVADPLADPLDAPMSSGNVYFSIESILPPPPRAAAPSEDPFDSLLHGLDGLQRGVSLASKNVDDAGDDLLASGSTHYSYVTPPPLPPPPRAAAPSNDPFDGSPPAIAGPRPLPLVLQPLNLEDLNAHITARRRREAGGADDEGAAAAEADAIVPARQGWGAWIRERATLRNAGLILGGAAAVVAAVAIARHGVGARVAHQVAGHAATATAATAAAATAAAYPAAAAARASSVNPEAALGILKSVCRLPPAAGST